jgi:type I restriction enzyme S subunit
MCTLDTPNHWKLITLNDLGEGKNAIVDGPFGSNLKISDYIDDKLNGVPVLTTKNLEGDYSDKNVRFISKEKFEELKRSEVKSGDIIIAKIGSIGKTGIYPNNLRSAIIPANLLKYTVTKKVVFNYVYNYLNFQGFQDHIKKISSATAQPAFNVTKFRKLHIPLPPFPEQQAIVSKIEQLFSDLDNGIDNFKKAQEQLKRYRQSVLKAACEGGLVPTEAELACAEGRDYEPADVLLARILKERREKWNGKGKYKEPAAPDTNRLPELPGGWVWSSFGLVFNVYVGATPSRKRQDYWGGRIPWVSSGEVAFCKIFQTTETITDLGLTNSSTVVHPPGTVLLGMIGEGKTRGQAAILEIAACNNQNSAAIRVSEIELPPEYIFYFLEGEYEHTRTIGSGNNQQALNKSRVQSMLFPLPPLAEQHRIVVEVERRLSLCDKMEATIAESIEKAESLRQSILKKAFEGKLLSERELEEARNAPDWEPAEKLLERIKAEKNN